MNMGMAALEYAEKMLATSERNTALASCDGSASCQSSLHIHGCFADKGNCDHPSEHRASGSLATGDGKDT